MKKIIDYTIVGEKYPHTLSEKVKEHMSEGWEPYGNITINHWCYQPMVKYEYMKS